MKNSIKLSALFLLLSAGIFASTAANAKDIITVSALKKQQGVAVNVAKANTGKTVVRIYDNDNHLILKDFLPNKTEVSKGYILSNLDNGDYTLEVTSNNEVVKKTLHIYDEDQKKTFFIVEQGQRYQALKTKNPAFPAGFFVVILKQIKLVPEFLGIGAVGNQF
ncbi:MAG TPA: hypothetical protein VIM77_13940 [Mucilaginibacter sp.]